MGVKITIDKVEDVLRAVKTLTRQQILVGVPSENAERQDDPGAKPSPINNAQLAYVQEFGSPAKNIPARPFLIPGVEDAMPKLLPNVRCAGEIGERRKRNDEACEGADVRI